MFPQLTNLMVKIQKYLCRKILAALLLYLICNAHSMTVLNKQLNVHSEIFQKLTKNAYLNMYITFCAITLPYCGNYFS